MNPIVIPQFYGDAGTFQALNIMREQVENSYLNPLIRERAASLTRLCDRHDRSCEHQTLCGFVRDSIQYVDDPAGIEVLADPVTFVERKLRSGEMVYGDCAQMVPYLASLLKASGHNPKFKVIGDNQAFHHVFIDCEGTELDPTMDPFTIPDYYDRFMLIEV
jgi:hypothetical protein